MLGDFGGKLGFVTDNQETQIGPLRERAKAAPASIVAAPPSPPIASIASLGPVVHARVSPRPSGFDGNDLATVIVAAGGAQMVGALQFAAIRAFLESRGRQRIVSATHVAPRRRSFSFGDGHCGTLLRRLNKTKMAGDSRTTRRLTWRTGQAFVTRLAWSRL